MTDDWEMHWSGIDIIPLVINGVRIPREQWLEIRKPGLGGSDIGTIVIGGRYGSKLTLYGEKIGVYEREPAGEAADWGNLLEDPVAQMYAKKTQQAVVNWEVMLRLQSHPFMLANIDRWIVEPSDAFPAGQVTQWTEDFPPPGILGILECKTAGIASFGTAHKWDADENNPDGAIPLGFALQGYHYGIVSGFHNITFAALLAGQGLQVRHLPWDDATADHIVNIEQAFWWHVENNIPPEADGSEATTEMLKKWDRRPDKKVELGNTIADKWVEYTSLKEVADRAEKEYKAVYNQILVLMGDGEIAEADGVPVCTYRGFPKETLDSKRLKEEHPELVAQYMRSSYVRQLRRAPKEKPPKKEKS